MLQELITILARRYNGNLPMLPMPALARSDIRLEIDARAVVSYPAMILEEDSPCR